MCDILFVLSMLHPDLKCLYVSLHIVSSLLTHMHRFSLTSPLCVQGVTTEQSAVRDVKASSSEAWGRTWPTAAAANRTVSSTNTIAIAASSAGWENALIWGWRLSVSLLLNRDTTHEDEKQLQKKWMVLSESLLTMSCIYNLHVRQEVTQEATLSDLYQH